MLGNTPGEARKVRIRAEQDVMNQMAPGDAPPEAVISSTKGLRNMRRIQRLRGTTVRPKVRVGAPLSRGPGDASASRAGALSVTSLSSRNTSAKFGLSLPSIHGHAVRSPGGASLSPTHGARGVLTMSLRPPMSAASLPHFGGGGGSPANSGAGTPASRVTDVSAHPSTDVDSDDGDPAVSPSAARRAAMRSLLAAAAPPVPQPPQQQQRTIRVRIRVDFHDKADLLFTRPADATPPVVFTTTDTQTLLELVLTQLRLPNCVHHPGELYLASEQIFMMDGTPVPSLVTPSQLCWCVLPSKLVLRATYRELLVVRRVLGNLVADARAERGHALASQSKLQESLAKTKQRLSAVLADLVETAHAVRSGITLCDISRIQAIHGLTPPQQDVVRSLAVIEGLPPAQATPAVATRMLSATTLQLLTSEDRLVKLPHSYVAAYHKFVRSSRAFAPEALCRMQPVLRKLHACLSTVARYCDLARRYWRLQSRREALERQIEAAPVVVQGATAAFERMNARLRAAKKQQTATRTKFPRNLTGRAAAAAAGPGGQFFGGAFGSGGAGRGGGAGGGGSGAGTNRSSTGRLTPALASSGSGSGSGAASASSASSDAGGEPGDAFLTQQVMRVTHTPTASAAGAVPVITAPQHSSTRRRGSNASTASHSSSGHKHPHPGISPAVASLLDSREAAEASASAAAVQEMDELELALAVDAERRSETVTRIRASLTAATRLHRRASEAREALQAGDAGGGDSSAATSAAAAPAEEARASSGRQPRVSRRRRRRHSFLEQLGATDARARTEQMLRFTSAPGFSTGGQTITFLMRMVPALYRIMLTYLSGGDFAALSLVNKEHAGAWRRPKFLGSLMPALHTTRTRLVRELHYDLEEHVMYGELLQDLQERTEVLLTMPRHHWQEVLMYDRLTKPLLHACKAMCVVLGVPPSSVPSRRSSDTQLIPPPPNANRDGCSTCGFRHRLADPDFCAGSGGVGADATTVGGSSTSLSPGGSPPRARGRRNRSGSPTKRRRGGGAAGGRHRKGGRGLQQARSLSPLGKLVAGGREEGVGDGKDSDVDDSEGSPAGGRVRVQFGHDMLLAHDPDHVNVFAVPAVEFLEPLRHVLSEHPPLPLREWADRGGALKRLALSEDQREALLKELKTDALSDAQVTSCTLLTKALVSWLRSFYATYRIVRSVADLDDGGFVDKSLNRASHLILSGSVVRAIHALGTATAHICSQANHFEATMHQHSAVYNAQTAANAAVAKPVAAKPPPPGSDGSDGSAGGGAGQGAGAGAGAGVAAPVVVTVRVPLPSEELDDEGVVEELLG